MGLGRWRAGGHQCGGGCASLHTHDPGSDLDLVAGAELDWAGDAPAVDEGAVGGAEVLDDDGAGVGGDPGVAAGDAGVVEDQVGAALLASEDQLAVDRVLGAGPWSL